MSGEKNNSSDAGASPRPHDAEMPDGVHRGAQTIEDIQRDVLEAAAKVATELMMGRNKVNRDGSVVRQTRNPTRYEIAEAIRALLSRTT